MSRATIHRADGRTEVIASKLVTSVSKGDRLVVETAGGGGFGDPKSRPRDAIAADLANHKISAAAARDTYGYP
jgi:N-methylhydantoinase B